MTTVNKESDTFIFSIYGEQHKSKELTETYFPFRSGQEFITICSDNNGVIFEDLLEILNTSLNGYNVIFVSKEKHTIRQAIYLMKKSKLHLCLNDWTKDLCKHQNINSINVEGIKLEDAAEKIFIALNVGIKPSFETVFVGEQYFNKTLEIIPNFDVNVKPNIDRDVVIRCDVVENWDFVAKMVSFGLNPTVISNTLPKKPLSSLCVGINEIFLFLNEAISLKEIQDCSSLGIKLRYAFENASKETKRKFIDLTEIVDVENWGEKNRDKLSNVLETTMLRSKRILIAEEKNIYSSVYHWKKGIDISKKGGNIVLNGLDSKTFLKEADIFYYYNQL